MVIALAFGLMAGISSFASPMRDETGAILGLVFGFIVAIIVAYAISLVASYFYKEAYEILAQATAHNLFKIAGLLMFIGAITIILFGLGAFADNRGLYSACGSILYSTKRGGGPGYIKS
jgi:uncharacterized membrane protein